MKHASRTIFVTAAAFWVASFFAATPASGTDLSEFLEKFTTTDDCNWAGFYVGVNNGATFNHFDLGKQKTDVDLVQQFYDLINGDQEGGDGQEGEGEFNFITFHTPGRHDTDTQTIGGGQTGFNWMFGHFLVGVEGGFSGNGSSAGGTKHQFQENELFLITEQSFVTAETDFTQQRLVETTWNGYIGGKVGFCWNRFLFYGTGGAAFTDAHFMSLEKADTSFFGFIGDGDGGGEAPTTSAPQVHATGPHQSEAPFIGEIISKQERNQGDVLTGWYGGVGTDYMLTNLVSIGVEYRHVDWGGITGHFMGGDGPAFASNGHLDVSADQVVFKVNILIGNFSH